MTQTTINGIIICIDDHIKTSIWSGVVTDITCKGHGLEICFDGKHITYVSIEQVTHVNGQAVQS